MFTVPTFTVKRKENGPLEKKSAESSKHFIWQNKSPILRNARIKLFNVIKCVFHEGKTYMDPHGWRGGGRT